MHFGSSRLNFCKIRSGVLLPFFCLLFLFYNLNFHSQIKHTEVTDSGMATFQELLEIIKHDENISPEIKDLIIKIGDPFLFQKKISLKNESLNDHHPSHFFILLFLLSDIPPPAFLF